MLNKPCFTVYAQVQKWSWINNFTLLIPLEEILNSVTQYLFIYLFIGKFGAAETSCKYNIQVDIANLLANICLYKPPANTEQQ